MKIVAEFQFTLEEFKEGMDALRKSVSSRRTSKYRLFIWVTIIAAAIAVFFTMNIRAASQTPPTPPAASPADSVLGIVLPILPWVLVLSVIYFYALRQLRRGHVKAWEAEPFLHRIRTLEIDDAGISTIDAVSQHRTLWVGYTQFAETTNLFVLFLSSQRAELIPKRVFASAQELQQLRELFTSNISAPQSAFPVLPVSEVQAKTHDH